MSSARVIDLTGLSPFTVVLNLDVRVYFSFRGHIYRVRRSARPALANAQLRNLPTLLWRHAEPPSIGGRLLHSLRLLPNPFMLATDEERRAMQHFVQVDLARTSIPQLSARGLNRDLMRRRSRPKES